MVYLDFGHSLSDVFPIVFFFIFHFSLLILSSVWDHVLLKEGLDLIYYFLLLCFFVVYSWG